MDIIDMSRKDFEAVPDRAWDEDIGEFNSLVILPLRRKHDSGYRVLDFVAVKDSRPIRRLSGCSDVLHLNGIGGYGDPFPENSSLVHPTDWSIDCLPKSGLLRLFCHWPLRADQALSSFCIYTVRKNDQD